jgi:hypothetical protein
MENIYSSKQYGEFLKQNPETDLNIAEYTICEKVNNDVYGLLSNLFNFFELSKPFIDQIDIEIGPEIFVPVDDVDSFIFWIKRNWKDLNLELNEGKKVSKNFVSDIKKIYLENSIMSEDDEFLQALDIIETEEIYSLRTMSSTFILNHYESIFKAIIFKMRKLFPFSEFVIACNCSIMEFNMSQDDISIKLEKLNKLKDLIEDICNYCYDDLVRRIEVFDSARETVHINGDGTFDLNWILEINPNINLENIRKLMKIFWLIFNNAWTEIKSITSIRSFLITDVSFGNTQKYIKD